MKYTGNIQKMKTVYDNPVKYFLTIGDKEVPMNDLISEDIEITFTGQINCIKCGRKTSKSFAQGYCYPCFQNAPETEECVLRPELCRAHEGVARDMDFAKEHCLIDHFVYLSYTSNLKVGVTRHSQIPTRWIDQGAVAAIKIARTENRYQAGLIEVALKKNLADKTNWRNMLKKLDYYIDLLQEKNKVLTLVPEHLQQFVLHNESEITFIKYPLTKVPDKFSSISFDKTNYITELLVGIKGQYLIFNSGKVLNVRKHGGYYIELNV